VPVGQTRLVDSHFIVYVRIVDERLLLRFKSKRLNLSKLVRLGLSTEKWMLPVQNGV
jgi:hypothetical protein